MIQNKFKTIITSLLLASTAVFTSCSDEDATSTNTEGSYTFQKPGTVSEVITKAALFSKLTEALVATDLTNAVGSGGPHTVFAPDNNAFETLLKYDVRWKKVTDIPKDKLTEILKYHIVNGSQINAEDISEDTEITMSNGDKVTAKLDEKENLYLDALYRDKDTAFVVSPNILATDGVIHMLSEVMLLEDIIIDAVDAAAATPELSKFVEAVNAAELSKTFKALGDHTFFAPNNAAFQALLDSNASWNNISDIPKEILQSVLKFHVIKGQTTKSESLKASYANTLSLGPNKNSLSLQIETEGGIKINTEATPVTPDVLVSNGVVHIIDKVMLPKNIIGLSEGNSDFTSLVEALKDSRHNNKFTNLLKEEGPFTIFAPTNKAFKALLDSNPSWNTIADIPIATLDAVLSYHVVSEENIQSSELKNGQELTMVNDVKMTVDLSDGAKLKTVGNATLVNISATDIQGTNGVIHVVDSVLLPVK